MSAVQSRRRRRPEKQREALEGDVGGEIEPLARDRAPDIQISRSDWTTNTAAPRQRRCRWRGILAGREGFERSSSVAIPFDSELLSLLALDHGSAAVHKLSDCAHDAGEVFTNSEVLEADDKDSACSQCSIALRIRARIVVRSIELDRYLRARTIEVDDDVV
jgi:hypothetical protein